MKYLLDVNTLVALGHTAHVHHERALAWLQTIAAAEASVGTCPITELGFVRVSVQAGLQSDVATARVAFSRMKKSSPVRFEFFNDSIGVDQMPAYVKTPGQITDGHLLTLARVHGIKFATLDTGIPGALILP
jgi:toxin-antitoxin system PIN domain toxin